MTNLADNGRWRVERVATPKGDRLDLIYADGSRDPIRSVAFPGQLGRPALEGDRLVFHEAGRLQSKLLEINLATGQRRTLRSTSTGVMLNPSLSGDRLLYVHSTFERQRLMLGTRGGKRDGRDDRSVFSTVPTARRDKGYENGRQPHTEGYRNGRGRKLPARPKPGVVETLWETGFTGEGANVTRLRHRPDGGVDTAVIPVKL